jgi:PrtD family type I secretion system ABC transporter
VILFSIVINVLMLAQPIYALNLFDRVLTSHNMVTLGMITLITAMMLLIMAAVEWARTQLLVRVSVRLDESLGVPLLELAHQLNIEQKDASGQRLLSDLQTLRAFLTGQSIFPLLDIPWVPVFFLVLLALHPKLALVTLTSAIVLFVLTYFTENLTKKPLEHAQNKAAEAARFASINMRNADVIESMGMLRAMSIRWRALQDEHIQAQASASDRAGLVLALSKFIKTVSQSAVMGAGAYLAVLGEISGGALMAAGMISGRMMMPIEMFIASWSQWGNAIEAWKRVEAATHDLREETQGVSLPAPKGEISLENVLCGPPGGNSSFLQTPALKIPAGASVAIIGASAAGKSTLLKAIAGVWPARNGTIRIDGADIRNWPREELGPHIGYLPQDVSLIEGSIAENIARHGEIDSNKVIAAAQAAGVHDMILHMSKGYSTEVGVNGNFLSGGQRQRVGLARALYGDPRILILDEPNANLDEAGEQALDAALRSAKARGATILMASHRPGAIGSCDLVLVMQSGTVTIYGPRDQVLQKLANAAASVHQTTASVATTPGEPG